MNWLEIFQITSENSGFLNAEFFHKNLDFEGYEIKTGQVYVYVLIILCRYSYVPMPINKCTQTEADTLIKILYTVCF